MSRGNYVTINTSVDVLLEDISDEDLIDELENRGYKLNSEDDIEDDSKYNLSDIEKLFELKRNNDRRFEEAFAEFVYTKIGRIL